MEQFSQAPHLDRAGRKWRTRTKTPKILHTRLKMSQRAHHLRWWHAKHCAEASLDEGVPRDPGRKEVHMEMVEVRFWDSISNMLRNTHVFAKLSSTFKGYWVYDVREVLGQ